MANSLMVGCAKLGMDVRIVAPDSLHPETDLVTTRTSRRATVRALFQVLISPQPFWPKAIKRAEGTQRGKMGLFRLTATTALLLSVTIHAHASDISPGDTIIVPD